MRLGWSGGRFFPLPKEPRESVRFENRDRCRHEQGKQPEKAELRVGVLIGVDRVMELCHR